MNQYNIDAMVDNFNVTTQLGNRYTATAYRIDENINWKLLYYTGCSF